MAEDTLRTLKLMNDTGYSIQQDNGQRIYGPPPDWTGSAPKDSEIFIGKLPNDIYEYDIVPLFSSVGKIYMLRIMQNFSGLNRGFAFVQYTTPEYADKAIRFLNNVEIRPCDKIGVVKSRNNCRLYIGKLDTMMTKEEIREELEKFTEDIVEVIIHKSDMPGQNNRGYAFVEYLTHKAAAKARRKLVPCKIKIRGIEVTVDWATPLHECGEILNVFNSVLIKNIRETATNDELCQFYSLSNSLKIVKFKRASNKLVISFNSRDDAEKAMQIYEELRNTSEFLYFAEKNKRVEMVWLKNNMNLSAFSSSINYTPSKFFDANRDECYTQSHHHTTSNVCNRSNSDRQIKNSNNSRYQSPNSMHPMNKPLVPSNSVNGSNTINGNSNVDKIRAVNQRYASNNQNKTNGPLAGRLSNRPMNGCNMNNGYESSSNTLAGRLNSNNQLGNALGNSPSFNCRTPTSPVDSNPFAVHAHTMHSRWAANGSTNPNVTTLNCNFNGPESFNQLNASNNMHIIRNLDRNPMFASMNSSYNFSIWKNYENRNLDESANWKQFKDRKFKLNSFSSHASSPDTNKISEEDSSSMKSDNEFSGSMDNFDCFNPINGLNLNENFRGLNLNRNLPKYPHYNPILQQ